MRRVELVIVNEKGQSLVMCMSKQSQ